MYKEINIKNLKISISNKTNNYIFIPTIGLDISSNHQSNQFVSYTVILAFINYNLNFRYVTINKNYKPYEEIVSKYDITFCELSQIIFFDNQNDKEYQVWGEDYYNSLVVIKKGIDIDEYSDFKAFVEVLNKGRNLTKEIVNQYMIDFDRYKDLRKNYMPF